MGSRPLRRTRRYPARPRNGEFGTTLSKIFEPETRTVFEWKRWETVRGRPVLCFRRQGGAIPIHSRVGDACARAVVGYRGLVFADRENYTVLRLITEAEAPPDFPLQGTTHTLEYGFVSIGGDRFVLPIHDEMLSRASLDFVQYGKLGGNWPGPDTEPDGFSSLPEIHGGWAVLKTDPERK